MLAGLALTLATLIPASASGDGPAASERLGARVVGQQGERIYVAALDSFALDRGATLSFLYRGESIATAEVVRAYGHELAVARLTSGSLNAAKKKLDRVQVLIERHALGARPMLRLGIPSRKRPGLLVACDDRRSGPPPVPSGYRLEASSPRVFRLVRDSSQRAAAPWPDTLTLRLFDEAADEEIALERGELDVAMFRPGELSAHVREHAEWRGFPFARAHGVLAAIAPGSAPGEDANVAARPDSAALAALERELFRGDLAPWPGPQLPAPPAGPVRFEVDPSCPGRAAMERVLNRERSPGRRPATPSFRVFVLDAAPDAPDSLAIAAAEYVRRGPFPPELRARAEAFAAAARGRATGSESPAPEALDHVLRETLGITLLFTLRTPIVCAPSLRPIVEALGPDALGALAECEPATAPR